jgi:hypothetical protein
LELAAEPYLPRVEFNCFFLQMKQLRFAPPIHCSRRLTYAHPLIRFAGRRKGSLSRWAALTLLVPSATLGATTAKDGIAARYPGDKNIASDPAVILADDFESYTSATQLLTKWTHAPGHAKGRLKISTAAGTFFAGKKGLEMNLPISTSEIACGLVEAISPTVDVLFIRMYQKWDTNYHCVGSSHNGLLISAKYPGPGIKPPADGSGFFLFQLDSVMGRTPLTGESDPGYDHGYVYWPKQRSNYGDWWYPDGYVIPPGANGNKGDWLAYPNQYPDFKPLPNHLPQRGRWYCYEMMVKANTPGQHNGEMKWWVDGKVVADFPNLFLRSLSSIKIDTAKITLDANSPQAQKLTKWTDNVVIAKQYIGPMASASAIGPSASVQTPTSPVVQSLKNISTRGMVQTADGVLIGGFILQGNASKEVVIRGLGPSLTASAVSNALRDPLIELYDSRGALIGSNDNWKTDFNHNSIPLALRPSNDFESALDRVLGPGSYTVILKDAQGQSGVGLFELYDLGDEGSILENISTRGVVRTGDDVMITGFILNGDIGSSQRVIVRALGPSLARFGVRDFLANPCLSVYDSNGILVGQNDNWRDDQAAEIAQTPFVPAYDLESGMILTLTPGSYTAILSGVNNTTGNAAVEVYVLN